MDSTERGAGASRPARVAARGAGRREQLADFAELVLGIARALGLHAAAEGDLVHLTATEVNVMRYVDRHPGVMPKDAAEGVGLQRSNFSAALRSLEARGMVESVPDASDRRSLRLFPTERSRKNLEQLRIRWAELLATALPAQADVGGCAKVLAEIECALVAGRRPVADAAAGVLGRSAAKRSAASRRPRQAGNAPRRRPRGARTSIPRAR